MSNFKITNTTNGKTNTLSNTLRSGATTIPGYREAGAAITGTALVNSTIEGATTGYRSGGVDIGTQFCAIYNESFTGTSVSLGVENYSSCSIVMCGGGGGGGGGARSPGTPQIRGGGGGPAGGSIIQRIPLTGINSITYTVGNAGSGGAGSSGSPVNLRAKPGNAGNASIVVIGAVEYRANGGGGGLVNPATAGSKGTISPTATFPTPATLNGPVVFQPAGTIVPPGPVSSPSDIRGGAGQPGVGVPGPSTSVAGNAGNPGGGGYVRIYLYP
jgi:hypothetical protein